MIRAAVSVPPQAYFVERIGGPHVEVQVLIPPGASPESYEPSPRQLAGLAHAQLYVEVGHPAFPLEGRYLAPILRRNPGVRAVSMSAGGDPAAPAEDPHLWLDPEVVRATSRAIADALAAIDPDHRPVYQANLAAFLADLDALEGEIRATLAAVPRRSFLVYHPAWGAFARRFGLEQIAIETEGKEPGPATLRSLIEQARAAKVRVLFVQPGFPTRSAQVIAEHIGAEVVLLDPLARDWLANLRQVATLLRRALTDGP